MPKGTIYTAEKRANSKARKAESDLAANTKRIESVNPLDYYPALYQRGALKQKRNETREAARNSPKGVKTAQVTSKRGVASEKGEWSEVTKNKKSGVTTTKFFEHSIVDNNKK